MNDQAATDLALAEELVSRGLAASRAQRAEEALTLFREAAVRAPHNGLPHFLQGAELAQLGRIDEAEAAYATAVMVAPGLEMARFQLGLLQFTSGRAAVALLTWEPLFRLPDTHVLQRAVHGFAALAQDEFDVALARFREAQQLEQNNAPLVRDLQMMIDRIEARNAGAPAASTPSVVPASPAAEESSEPDEHVLLSNYQRQGPLH